MQQTTVDNLNDHNSTLPDPASKDWQTRPPDDPMGLPEKCLLIFGGVIAPAITHLVIVQQFAGNSLLSPRYQTGLLKDKLAFLLTFQALAWLYPMILFSMTAFTMSVVEIRYSGKTLWVRSGLWSGIPLGLTYHLVIISQLNFAVSQLLAYHLAPIAIVLVAWGLVKGLLRFCKDRRAAWFAGMSLLVGVTTFGSAIVVIATGDQSNWIWMVFPVLALLYIVLFYGPMIWLGCYGWMIGRVMSMHPTGSQYTLGGLLAAMTWLGFFFAGCRHAVLQSVKIYSQLPLTDPGNCYVATAASRGHPWVVGARKTESGHLINRQLRILKGWELALMTLAPKWHRRLRRVYDCWGVRIARRARTAWRADCCYLLLKPLEWFAWLMLWGLLGRRINTIEMLYRDVNSLATQPLSGLRRASSPDGSVSNIR